MTTKNFVQTVSQKIQTQMDQRASAVADRLAYAYQVGDAQKVSRADWMDMIRRNWQDPKWRAEHAMQVGPVQLVKDALEAHGLNPSLLNQNADVINMGLTRWNVDATKEYADFMAKHADEHGLPGMPPEQFPVNQPDAENGQTEPTDAPPANSPATSVTAAPTGASATTTPPVMPQQQPLQPPQQPPLQPQLPLPPTTGQ